ncbi:magnesium and cobalt transport protein CorA [Pantoea agglomerans]|jgi:magnesium transporter|uniref:Magnesium transport protein CorA n=4 Tax=Enterobacter agglomerans TaxID=549 RepID=A0A379AJG0_ENTAG|nr:MULTISPECIES: magnesium and cobalt transport protein CorA [Pantoea]MDF9909652.1 magnesium transporter [Pantoea brenneri]AYP24098.1 magnesium and cobalt transport protein CorA [Pantoea agglomerans]AZI50244.1 magnesium and cobalt transport protein CorA [Pantoea agglomerans]ERM07726.1 magnesium transporter CorA [Pantoea agglomerans Tx10]EZI35658.1 CorA-like transporter protein [Pantoea agglomerans]
MIVSSRVYRPGCAGEEVEVDDISEVIKEPEAFIWLGLWQPDAEFMAKIKEEFGLHELAVEDALNAHQRPKIEHYGESLFIVVKTVCAKDDSCELGETHLFVGKNFLISIRHGASESYTPVRQRAAENPALLKFGPAYPLYCLLDFIVDRYAELSTSLNERVGQMENDLFTSEFDRKSVQSVYTVRRHLLKLRNAALPVEEICNQLIHLHEDLIPRPLRAYIRDVQDHARHVVTDAEDMREMLTSAMQVNLALVTVQQNEVVKKLAGWGAILVIPTVVFSMYGMNFEHMPELKSLYGYPLAVGLTLLACGGLWAKLRRSGWL